MAWMAALVLVAAGCQATPAVTDEAVGIEFDTPPVELDAAATDSPPPITRTMTVLFVGNSYTYYNDMPATVAALAKANGTDITFSTITDGGADMMVHAENPVVGQALASGAYDTVVLQEQSMIGALYNDPSFPTIPIISAFADVAADSSTRLVLFQTWGHRNGNRQINMATYEDMQRAIIDNYAAISAATGARVAPVGEAWWNVLSFAPEVNLYDADGSHPSPAGSYLAALVLTSAITNKPVEHLVGYDDIGAATATALRDHAR